MDTKGVFTISLDFELYWGMKDVISVEGYANHLKGTSKAVKAMLALFEKYEIHVTWATIGYLFCKDVKELQANYPTSLPKYKDEEINLYNYLEQNLDMTKEYHFADKLVTLIAKSKNQEMATHTFSHYYCLEEGQDKASFRADLEAAKKIADEKNINLKSLVFPRNQYNKEYLEVIKEAGITSYRGNEKGYIYDATSEEDKKTPLKRGLRIVDSYINISGFHTYKLKDIAKSKPYNIPASRFLRPYSSKLAVLDKLKIKRITDAMTHSAKTKELFHLWWHPHNFGVSLDENLAILEEILKHFKKLEKEYDYSSQTMQEISQSLLEK